MRFLELANGKHSLFEAEVYYKDITSVQGKHRLDYPVYPYYDLNVYKPNEIGETILEFKTVVEIKNVLVGFSTRYSGPKISHEYMTGFLSRFENDVALFRIHTNVKKMIKECKNE